ETSTPADVAAARATVDEVTGLRRRTRRARQAYWLPLVVFGVLVLGAAPFYELGPAGGDGLFTSDRDESFPGLFAPHHLGAYWVIGTPLAYLASAGFYLWRRRRRGVGTSPLAYALVGVGLVVLLGLVTSTVADDSMLHGFRSVVPGDLLFRGLLPLLVIA